MSGGFFRGTSADQDTRFSNKQAKLLKSQKFPSELEHLVDMTKVKMDAIRPWIATRATQLLGFEDEVLINFIYGLLDVKLVDGKKIQIQLTGFMEKNTGKFMKELWGLLLSAQNNVSGVPQQFLDAKEEETRKKKAETDTIASEIQKRRERERKSRFEDEADAFRSVNVVPESVPRHSRGSSSSIAREEERKANGRLGSTAINGRSRSPQPNVRSPSPYRSTTSPTRSTKETIARSRSHSGEEPKSRSVSVSSHSQGRSVSPERQYESPARRSLSPERRYRSPRRSSSPRRRRAPLNTESPLRRRSPHLRRRSTSRSRHRSPPYRQRSPRARQRSPPSPRRRSPSLSRRRIPSPPRRGSISPLRRRSPSPLRRRSPSPLRRRSRTPLRRRSPSPLRRRSRTPLRRRSPSPRRRRSPFKARRRSPSPLCRRSPIRHRSPSPWRRSPLRGSPNHQRRSLVRSPINHPVDSHSSPRQRKRGHSPYRSRSPLYQTRRSLSRERDARLHGHSSRRHRDEHDSQRTHEQNSPVSHDLDRELAEHAGSGQKASEIASRKVPISLRSPQRDVGNQNDHHDKVAAAITEDCPSQSDSPANTRKLNSRITRRFRSLSKSPVSQTRVKMPRRRDSPGTSREEKETSRAREVLRHKIDSSGKRSDNSQRDTGLKRSYIDDHGPESNSPDRVSPTQSPASRGRPVNPKKSSGHRSDVDLPERHSQQVSYSSDDNEYDPKSVREERGSLGDVHNRQRSAKHHPKDAPILEEKAHNEKTDGYRVNDGKRPQSKEHREPHQELESIKRKVDKSIRRDSKDSDSENSDKHHMEKRGHRRSDKRKRDSDESSESDSQIDDRKEAKRKRKEEKRLRKEEKHRRREEKHRKRLERRVKQKVKSVDTVTPPLDFEGNDNDSDNSDVDANMRKKFHPFDADEIESEQKKLEIELRKKALESLRAKKAISH